MVMKNAVKSLKQVLFSSKIYLLLYNFEIVKIVSKSFSTQSDNIYCNWQ